MSTLELLSALEARSPKVGNKDKQSGDRWLAMCAAVVQAEVDQWWQETAGWNPDVVEGYMSVFSYFLVQIFLALSGPTLGASRTAVEGRRRLLKKRDKEFKMVREKLQAKTAKHPAGG